MSKFDQVLAKINVEKVVEALHSGLVARKVKHTRGRTVDFGPDFAVQLRAVEIWKSIQEASIKVSPHGGDPSQPEIQEHWKRVEELQSKLPH